MGDVGGRLVSGTFARECGSAAGSSETARLESLRQTGLLDSPSEPSFDRLTRLAARFLNAPVALVSLVDADRQFFKSSLGLPEPWASRRQTPLSHSFCQHVVASREPLVIADARQHPLVCDNLAIRDLAVVAYLGIPLLTPDGYALGSLCVIDGRPREWLAGEVEVMHELAALVMTEVQLRREAQQRQLALEQLREKDERLKIALQTGKLGSWQLDLSTGVLESSEQFRANFGLPPDADLSYETLFTLIHPDDRDAVREAVSRLGAGHNDYRAEYRTVWPDGSLHWINARGCLLNGVGGRPTQLVGFNQDITDHKRAEEDRRKANEELERRVRARTSELAEANEDLRRQIEYRKRAEEGLRLRDRAFEAFVQGVLITDPSQPDNPIVYSNQGFEKMTGYTQAEVQGRNCRFLQGPRTDPAAVNEIRAALREHRPCLVELLNYRKDGTPFWNALSLAPVHDDGGNLSHFIGVQTDITPLKNLEEQFRQAQKMEAFGQLAGGVAHDFNNLLTVISGFSEMLLGKFRPDDPARELIQQIYHAGERAAMLTRQLLAFSRRQVVEPKVLDLNAVVTDAGKMLGRLIGEDIRLTTALAPDLGRVKADAGQVEQVIVNLAVNARDAMPQGGNLTVETANVELDEGYARSNAGVKPGRYVLLAVRDNGCGMDEATKLRIFEPFFTTKEVGKGTGLGLATVYSIVQQSGGHIGVQSEPGRGTTFKVFLPLVGEAVHSTRPGGDSVRLPTGKETVLLVEDEDGVRGMTRYALETYGYMVLEARNGDEAVRVAEGHEGPLHLLMTDVVMPGMGGRQVAERLARLQPGIKVLYLSGYTDDAVVRHGVLHAEAAFLQKPFTMTALTSKVREVLDQ